MVPPSAMYRSALKYGAANADHLVQYHISNGGIGRAIKFRWFIREFLGINKGVEEEVSALNREYRKNLWGGLMTCEISPGIHEILASLRKDSAKLFVVSGADQDELREILRARKLASFFDGIYGAPDNKDQILAREIGLGAITRPAIFLGDSLYDYEASQRARMDFVFISKWSDFKGGQTKFQSDSGVYTANNVAEFFG